MVDLSLCNVYSQCTLMYTQAYAVIAWKDWVNTNVRLVTVFEGQHPSRGYGSVCLHSVFAVLIMYPEQYAEEQDQHRGKKRIETQLYTTLSLAADAFRLHCSPANTGALRSYAFLLANILFLLHKTETFVPIVVSSCTLRAIVSVTHTQTRTQLVHFANSRSYTSCCPFVVPTSRRTIIEGISMYCKTVRCDFRLVL